MLSSRVSLASLAFSLAPSARALPTERRTSDCSHAIVQEVIGQVPHARVAVPALDVLVMRPDDDARRGFAHEQSDVALLFGSHGVGRSRQKGSVKSRGVAAEFPGRALFFRRGFLSMSRLRRLSVCLRRWKTHLLARDHAVVRLDEHVLGASQVHAASL